MIKEKKCSKCKKIKLIENFQKSKKILDGFFIWCKECRAKYDHDRHVKLREKIINQKKEYRRRINLWYKDYKKNLKCEKCGDTRWYVLTFHHKDKNNKSFDISNGWNRFSKKRIEEEIKKCEVLCANCHMEIHYEE